MFHVKHEADGGTLPYSTLELVMTHCIKFSHYEIFASSYEAALVAALALAKSNHSVQIWEGSKLVWDYNNR